MSSINRNKLILILGAISALGPLSIDMYLPGFPQMAKDLSTDISKISLSLTSYFVGIAMGQLIYGPILDRYGRKKPLLIGFAIYLIAAITCAISPNIDVLIASRLLLALGGCVGMVASRAIIRDVYESKEIARAFSTLILVMGVAPIVAPTLGGYIITHFGWRSIFWFLTFYCFILLIVINYLLEETHKKDLSVSLKPIQVTKNYWAVLKNKEFLAFGLAGTIGIAGLFTYISGSPFVIMEIIGFNEKTFGWLFGINATGFIATSQLNKVLLKKRDTEKVTRTVCYIALLASIFLVVQTLEGFNNPLLFLISLFVFVATLGIINPNLQALGLEPFKQNAGVASALIGSIRMFGGALASALVGFFHDGSSKPMVFMIFICALGTLGILLIYSYSKK